jgi:NAD(P)-dependent dehydrogenase (short-subunit alcohol dehydrogenase family)
VHQHPTPTESPPNGLFSENIPIAKGVLKHQVHHKKSQDIPIQTRTHTTMSKPSYDQEDPPRPSRSLAGRVAVVTGAGSRANGIGNGRGASILLAEAGAQVVCADLNIEWAQITVDMITREFGENKAISVQADVSQTDDCKRIVDTALSVYGRVDILVNNVGVGGPMGTAVEVDPAKWARGLEINVTSMVLMSKFAIPAMRKNIRDEIGGCGAIVNIASVAGMIGGSPMLLYPTSKGAVINMTRAMAFQHAPDGIRVNCVCPGKLIASVLNNLK